MLKSDVEFFRIVYHFFIDGTRLTYATIGATLFVAVVLFKPFFGDLSEFLTPESDYTEYNWKREKTMVWLMLSVGSGIVVYNRLPATFPHLFPG